MDPQSVALALSGGMPSYQADLSTPPVQSGVWDPFGNSVQGKDQSRVPQGPLVPGQIPPSMLQVPPQQGSLGNNMSMSGGMPDQAAMYNQPMMQNQMMANQATNPLMAALMAPAGQ